MREHSGTALLTGAPTRLLKLSRCSCVPMSRLRTAALRSFPLDPDVLFIGSTNSFAPGYRISLGKNPPTKI